MKRALTFAIALSLSACALHSKQVSTSTPEASADATVAQSASDLALQANMESSRAQASAAVALLRQQGDPNGFLGQTSFCANSSFLCSKLQSVDFNKRQFLNQVFLNPTSYATEALALQEDHFVVTSDPVAVTVNGVVKLARADAAKKEIRFYAPWLSPLTPAERVAVLLHEICHTHMGLPDENVFGPFSLTQEAIDASAASQAVFWIGHALSTVPSLATAQSWPLIFADSAFGTGETVSSDCPNVLDLPSNFVIQPCSTRSPSSVKRSEFFAYLTPGPAYGQTDQPAVVRLTFRGTDPWNTYALELSRAAAGSQQQIRLLRIHAWGIDVLATRAMWGPVNMLAWGNTITVYFSSSDVFTLNNAVDEGSDITLLQSNASASFTLNSPF